MSTSEQPPRVKAYSYTRFSTPEQALGDSARRQLQRAEEYAARHDLELDTSLKDEGVSAFRGKNMDEDHSALGSFVARVRARDVEPGSVLLVENLDRFSRRDPLDAAHDLRKLCKMGITVVTLHNGKAYTGDALSDMGTVLTVVVELGLAHEESVKKSDRLRRAWDGKRAKLSEKPLTSLGPAWLRLVDGRWEVLEERAEIVRRIYGDTLLGCSPHAIATALNLEGVSVFGHGKRTGKHWHRSYVVKLLQSPAVIGTMIPHTGVHDGGKYTRKALAPVPGYFPAIVPDDVYASVQALRLDSRSPLRGRHATGHVSNIFGGLAKCGACGQSSMRFVNKGSGWTYLVCSRAVVGAGCKYDAVRYQTLEDAFRAYYGNVLGTAPAGAEAPDVDSQLESLGGAISALEDRLETLLVSRERTASVSLSQRISATAADLDELRAEHAALLERQSATIGRLRAQRMRELANVLDAPELDRKAANLLMRQLFSRVTLYPEQGVLSFAWKQGGAESDLPFSMPRDPDEPKPAKHAATRKRPAATAA